jgi:predicted Zn-ribbon and HTH transcriptional regulator
LIFSSFVQNMVHTTRRKNKEPAVPVSRNDTIRKYITTLLEEATFSAKDLSQFTRIPEKDVCDHLEHVRKTLNKNNRHLEIIPAQCEKCGFIYKKRDRFSKPGKCPLCHSSLIYPPRFHIEIE